MRFVFEIVGRDLGRGGCFFGFGFWSAWACLGLRWTDECVRLYTSFGGFGRSGGGSPFCSGFGFLGSFFGESLSAFFPGLCFGSKTLDVFASLEPGGMGLLFPVVWAFGADVQAGIGGYGWEIGLEGQIFVFFCRHLVVRDLGDGVFGGFLVLHAAGVFHGDVKSAENQCGALQIDGVAHEGVHDFHQGVLDGFFVFDERDGMKSGFFGATDAAVGVLVEVAELFAFEGGGAAADSR